MAALRLARFRMRSQLAALSNSHLPIEELPVKLQSAQMLDERVKQYMIWIICLRSGMACRHAEELAAGGTAPGDDRFAKQECGRQLPLERHEPKSLMAIIHNACFRAASRRSTRCGSAVLEQLPISGAGHKLRRASLRGPPWRDF